MSGFQERKKKRLIVTIVSLFAGLLLAFLIINITTGGQLIKVNKDTPATTDKKISDVFKEEPCIYNGKTLNLSLKNGEYRLSKEKDPSQSFIGKYEVYKLDLKDERLPKDSTKNNQKAYLVKCYYNSHFMGSQSEYYNSKDKKYFEFALTLSDKGKYTVYDLQNLKEIDFSKTFF